MKLGMHVGLGPGLSAGDFVLDADPVNPLPNKGRSAPKFRAMFIVAKRLDA